LKRGGVNKIWIDDFNCKIKDDIYEWYYPLRRDYAQDGKQKIIDNLRRKSDKQRLEDLKTMRNIRRYEKEIFGEDHIKQEAQANV
jgi:hypothetical protein